MPSLAIAITSVAWITLNSSGVPPADRTPALTASETERRWMFSGATSFHELATAMRGRSSSAAVRPAPAYQLLAKILSNPACRAWLL